MKSTFFSLCFSENFSLFWNNVYTAEASRHQLLLAEGLFSPNCIADCHRADTGTPKPNHCSAGVGWHREVQNPIQPDDAKTPKAACAPVRWDAPFSSPGHWSTHSTHLYNEGSEEGAELLLLLLWPIKITREEVCLSSYWHIVKSVALWGQVSRCGLCLPKFLSTFLFGSWTFRQHVAH